MIKILVVLFLLLTGCNQNNSLNEHLNDNEDNYNKIKLTLDNMWYYFDYDISEEFNSNQSGVLYVDFWGSLTFALYENVVVNLKLEFNQDSEEHKLKLKSNGDGNLLFEENYIPFDQDKKLILFNRRLIITDINGDIIYNI